jgi:hypothetical protein
MGSTGARGKVRGPAQDLGEWRGLCRYMPEIKSITLGQLHSYSYLEMKPI